MCICGSNGYNQLKKRVFFVCTTPSTCKMNNQESSDYQDAASGTHVVHTIRSILAKSKLDNKTVGFVDSENYMLRGISPGPEPRARSSSLTGYNGNKPSETDVDLDMLYLRETMRCLATTETGIEPDVSATTCARVMSFHTFFCTCNMSCCCMCGSLCSTDCRACFHKVCARFTTIICQKNGEPLPRLTVDSEKVSFNSQQTFYTRSHRSGESALIEKNWYTKIHTHTYIYS